MLCKIIIKDEVNCKLEGLDLNTRRKLQRKFEVEIPHARYLPSVRLGRWNGKTSYFDLGGRTYVKLLDEIVPILVDENYEVELEDHRVKYDFEFDAITEDELAHMNWPPGLAAILASPDLVSDWFSSQSHASYSPMSQVTHWESALRLGLSFG